MQFYVMATWWHTLALLATNLLLFWRIWYCTLNSFVVFGIFFPASLQVSPTMCAEELTNQILYLRNVPAVENVWMTFEVIEDGELGK